MEPPSEKRGRSSSLKTSELEKSEVLTETEVSSENASSVALPPVSESEKLASTDIEKEKVTQDGSPEAKEENGVVENGELSSNEAAEVELPEKIYPTGVPFFILTLALMATIFVAGLDQNILSTAIPKIVTQFNSLSDVAMYTAAYGIGQMVSQPTFGKIYTYFNTKWLFAISFLIFEVGSITCATAPNSVALISGRAIAGVGYAGLYSGTWLIVVDSVPLRRRPFYISIISTMFAVAGVAGPLLGGLFADSRRLTWRFGFWVNLPIGAFVVTSVLLIFKPETPEYANMPLREKMKKLDLLGAAFLVPAITFIQVALQRGGTLYPWSNPNVWAMFVAFGILISIFIVIQVRKGDLATIPPRLLKNRNIYSTYIFASAWGIAVPIHMLYLSFYFQTIKNTSAVESGIRILPYCITTTVGVVASGGLITLWGQYVPFMFLGAAVLSVGSGLLSTMKVGSGIGEWFGYQVVTSLGFGLGAQIPYIVIQNCLPAEDISTGTALIIFFQNFVGAVGIGVAQNVFLHTLKGRLSAIPGVNVKALLEGNATEVRKNVAPALLARVLEAYNYSLMRAFAVAIAGGGLGFLISFMVEWKKIEKGKEKKPEVLVDGA